MLEMKPKMRELTNKRRSGNENVRREIACFLRALHSYPERFAQNPSISFEEHRSALVRSGKPEHRRRA
jgi:hypothetical protein